MRAIAASTAISTVSPFGCAKFCPMPASLPLLGRRLPRRRKVPSPSSAILFKQDIIKYQTIARFIGDHCLENILDGRSRGVQCGLELEACVPYSDPRVQLAF